MCQREKMGIHSLCVFCGSAVGARAEYAEAARSVGRELATRSIRLIYGGGRVGLMGTIADAALAAGGEVVGVIPRHLADWEIAHQGLTDLRIVTSMHERKAMMAELADGFVALPGGCGTFEEFCEVLTWSQLGLNPKPCGLLNVAHYYDALIQAFDHGVAEGFIRPPHRELIILSDAFPELLSAMEAFRPLDLPKWAEPSLRET